MWQLPFLPDLGSFPQGTHVLTNRGDVPVEALAPGDVVLTAGGGNATIRKMTCRSVRYTGRWGPGRPVLIRAGMLGGGLPVRDLAVAPGQRLAIADVAAGDVPRRAELLVPAAALTGLTGIRRMRGRRQMRLYAVVLDAPKLIVAEGCLTESALPLAVRLANRLTAGWAGALAGRLRTGERLRALSVRQSRRLAARLRETGELPRRLARKREHDLAIWDADLAIERRLSETARPAPSLDDMPIRLGGARS